LGSTDKRIRKSEIVIMTVRTWQKSQNTDFFPMELTHGKLWFNRSTGLYFEYVVQFMYTMTIDGSSGQYTIQQCWTVH